MRQVLLPTLIVLALLAFPSQAEETLVVLRVNGKVVSKEPQILDPDALSFPGKQWTDWGVVIPVPLRDKQDLTPQELGVSVEYDTQMMEIRIDIPAHLRVPKAIGYTRTIPGAVTPAPRGVMVDYDLAATHDGNSQRLSAGHVARMGVAGGVLTTTGQANWVDGKTNYVRGTTTWKRDNLSAGTTLQMGDVGLASNGLNNQTVLGGVRIGTDRHLTRPGAAMEIPLIGGVADTRSTAEVLVNEHLRATGQVPPGPFELQNSIAVPGVNHLEITQRDQFGREQTIARSFYAHPDLLRKGSSEWSVSAGAVRPNPAEDKYEGFAAQGMYHRGLSDSWTMGVTTQLGKLGDEGGRNVTLHNTVSLGRGGLIQADVSASQRDDGSRGAAVRLAYEHRRENWSVSASHTRKSDDYWEISQLQNSAFRIRSQTSAALAFQPESRAWRTTLSYSDVTYDNDRRLRQAGLTGTYRQGRTTWLGGLVHNLENGDNQAFVGVHMPLGTGRFSASVRSSPNMGERLTGVYSDKASIAGHDVRYRVGATVGERSDAYGRVDTSLAGGELTLEASKGQDTSLVVAGRYVNSVWIGEGGVVNGRGYNPQGSFTLVSVSGYEGVNVRGSSSPVTSNKNGYALLQHMPSLTPVPVSVDVNQLPIDTQIDNTTQMTVAPRGGGAKVNFDITTSTWRQFTVRIGKDFAPAKSIVTTSTNEVSLVAERGVLVLEGTATRATLKSGSINCELVLPPEGGDVVCNP